jgi:hypothetical protein
MTDRYLSNQELIGRDDVNDLEEILAIKGPAIDEIIREVPPGGEMRFTWDYEQTRPALQKLYGKAKRSQWDAATDIDWSTDVDVEKIGWGLLELQPELAMYRRSAKTDPSLPMYGWSDEQFVGLAVEYQAAFLSQIVHGEQGALLCTNKIAEQVPWIDAKYFASTQVMDEARHVEVFIRYLDTKLHNRFSISGSLLQLIEDVLRDDRWDITYMGMQIMIEGLALAAFGFAHATTPDPLLKSILRYVMSDEARHVAFGVLSLQELYAEMSASEIRERQEFTFEAGLRMRDRTFNIELFERVGVDPRAQLQWQLDNIDSALYGGILFAKIVPNIKKLGLLDAGDGWLRRKYTEMGVIQYEDWMDTTEEYATLDAFPDPT